MAIFQFSIPKSPITDTFCWQCGENLFRTKNNVKFRTVFLFLSVLDTLLQSPATRPSADSEALLNTADVLSIAAADISQYSGNQK